MIRQWLEITSSPNHKVHRKPNSYLLFNITRESTTVDRWGVAKLLLEGSDLGYALWPQEQISDSEAQHKATVYLCGLFYSSCCPPYICGKLFNFPRLLWKYWSLILVWSSFLSAEIPVWSSQSRSETAERTFTRVLYTSKCGQSIKSLFWSSAHARG